MSGWEFQHQYYKGNVIYSMDQLNGKHIAGMGQSQPAQIEPGMPPAWNSYIFVEDSRATSAQCEALGAKVLAGPMDVSE